MWACRLRLTGNARQRACGVGRIAPHIHWLIGSCPCFVPGFQSEVPFAPQCLPHWTAGTRSGGEPERRRGRATSTTPRPTVRQRGGKAVPHTLAHARASSRVSSPRCHSHRQCLPHWTAGTRYGGEPERDRAVRCKAEYRYSLTQTRSNSNGSRGPSQTPAFPTIFRPKA